MKMCKGLADLCADARNAGIEEGLKLGREEGLKLGREEGLKQVREQELKLFIRSCKELTDSKEVTVKQLVKIYEMSDEIALEKVELYW